MNPLLRSSKPTVTLCRFELRHQVLELVDPAQLFDAGVGQLQQRQEHGVGNGQLVGFLAPQQVIQAHLGWQPVIVGEVEELRQAALEPCGANQVRDDPPLIDVEVPAEPVVVPLGDQDLVRHQRVRPQHLGQRGQVRVLEPPAGGHHAVGCLVPLGTVGRPSPARVLDLGEVPVNRQDRVHAVQGLQQRRLPGFVLADQPGERSDAEFRGIVDALEVFDATGLKNHAEWRLVTRVRHERSGVRTGRTQDVFRRG